MSIPPKQLKEVTDIISEPLLKIWNEEIIGNKKFSSKLKWADMTPIFKKLETVTKGNYKPISLLPVVSKIFERIMDKQIGEYMEKYLSIYYSFSSSKFTCQYCGFVSEKKAGLSAHERGCKVKKELENN